MIEGRHFIEIKDTSARSPGASSAPWESYCSSISLSRSSERGVHFCPYARRIQPGAVQSLNLTTVSLSRIGNLRIAVQQSKPAQLTFTRLLLRCSTTMPPGYFVWGEFLVYARERLSLAEPKLRTSAGPRRIRLEMGLAGFCLCCDTAFPRSLSQTLFETVWGADSFKHPMAFRRGKSCTTSRSAVRMISTRSIQRGQTERGPDPADDCFALAIPHTSFSPE